MAVPESLNGELRPYQQLGMSWLWFLRQYGFGACLADDMGLGKTVQLISYLLMVKEIRSGVPAEMAAAASRINQTGTARRKRRSTAEMRSMRRSSLPDFGSRQLAEGIGAVCSGFERLSCITGRNGLKEEALADQGEGG